MKSRADMTTGRSWNVTRPVRAAVLGLGIAATMALATPAMAAQRATQVGGQAGARTAAPVGGSFGAAAPAQQASLGQALGLTTGVRNGSGFALGVDLDFDRASGGRQGGFSQGATRQGAGFGMQQTSWQQAFGAAQAGMGLGGEVASQRGQTAYQLYNPTTGTIMQTGSPLVHDIMQGSGWSIDMGTTRQISNVPGMNVGQGGQGLNQGGAGSQAGAPGFDQNGQGGAPGIDRGATPTQPTTPTQPGEPSTPVTPSNPTDGDATKPDDATTDPVDDTTTDDTTKPGTTPDDSTTTTDPIDIPAAAGTITFANGGISVGDGVDGVKVDGSELTIKESGSYVVTGSCSEGSIKVKKGVTGVFLTLKDLDLSCSTTAPLAVNKGSEAVVNVEGTVTLTDAEDASTEDTNEDFEGAAIKVKGLNDDTGAYGKLTITGTGTLKLNGNAKNGIKGASGATVTIAGATLDVKAANNGIACDNVVNLNAGTVSVTSGNDGIKAEIDDGDTVSAGVVNLAGAAVTINATGEGVQATGDVNVTAGSVNVKAGEKGLKSDTNVNVTGGTVTVNATDDGIHSNDSVTIAGGTTTIATGDDGVHADNVLTVSDGNLTVTKSYEGLEGTTVNIEGGTVNIASSDDGINAANKYRAYGSNFAINVSGGTTYVNAGGDGLDSNGNITTSGGTVEVYGAPNNGNGAMDIGDGGNYSWTANGGTVLAVGMSGMAVAPSNGTSVVFGAASGMGGQPGQMGGMQQSTVASSVSISAGSPIVISDASGNVVYSATGMKSANHVVFASAGLVSGQTYTLSVNGKAVATATAGTNAGMGGQMGGQPGQMGGQPGQTGTTIQQPGQMGQPGQQGGMGQQPGGQMGGGMGR